MSRPAAHPHLILLCAALLSSAQAGGSEAVQTSSFQTLAPPPAEAARPLRELQLAAAPDGSLVLALLNDAGQADSGKGMYESRKVRVWRNAGGGWEPLRGGLPGGVLNYDVPRPASNMDLALDGQGTPIMVWNENYGDNDVVVFRAYQDGNWTDWFPRYLGDDLPYAARTRSVVAQNGEPVLAWGETLRTPYGSRLTVRRWDAATKTWNRSPAFNTISVFSRTPALALNAAGQPVVAWLQGEVLASNVFVKRWNGTVWEALGGSLNRTPDRYLAATRLKLDAQGQPTVAWLEDLNGKDALYVSRWDGQQWQALGGPVSANYASGPALALDAGGQPVLAWVEERSGVGQIHLARWNGGRWQDSGVINLDPRKDARAPSLAVLPDGEIVLAWREDVNGVYGVQLRKIGGKP
ncbi:sialidase family protein [Deinococcus marmoris]|uniref:sialidase family protein n=1 Tax=Deinococcus marmoris TaxID=249408 RepID=UPI0004975D16|nr:sialidase family protein [Deinococcus marmoris]